MVWIIIILGVVLAIFLYNNGKNHTMVDQDIHKYNFAQTDAGDWVNFPTVFKLTGDNNIIIQTPDERIVILDVIEIEPNMFTGTLDHFKVFTSVYMSNEKAFLHIMGSSIVKYKKLKNNTKVDAHEKDKNDSLIRLANSYGCSPNKVKQNFIDEFSSIPGSSDQEVAALNLYRKEKLNEAKIFNIDPNDTASAIMESWLIEFFKKKENLDRQRTIAELIGDIMEENPAIYESVKSGNKDDVRNYLDNNPDLLDSFEEALAFEHEPAEVYRKKAIDKMFDDKDYTGAIHLLDKGLELDDPKTRPFLYQLRAECEKSLLNYNVALKDINSAIGLITIFITDGLSKYYSTFGKFLKIRSEIRDKLGDKEGANLDRIKANEILDDYDND